MPDVISSIPQNQIEKSPDWRIGSLYSRDFEIVKHNKWLWVLGLAASGSGFSNLSGYSHWDSKDFEFIQKFFQNTSSQPSQASRVLGSSTSVAVEAISRLFSGVPLI